MPSAALGTQMKATGEVMSIAPTFEQGLLKAVRSLEQNSFSLIDKSLKGLTREELLQKLHDVDDRRLFVLAEALRRGLQLRRFMPLPRLIPGSWTRSWRLSGWKKEPEWGRVRPCFAAESKRDRILGPYDLRAHW